MSCNGGSCGDCECPSKEEMEARQAEQKRMLDLWKNIFHKALGANTLTEEEAALVKEQLERFPK